MIHVKLENDQFTSDELDKIYEKYRSNKSNKFLTSFFGAILFCFIGPLIPRKRSRTAMIENYSYREAVFYWFVFTLVAFIIYQTIAYFKYKKEIQSVSKSLNRKFVDAEITGKRKEVYKGYINKLELLIEEESIEVELAKGEHQKYVLGQGVFVEIENHTKTVFKIDNLELKSPNKASSSTG